MSTITVTDLPPGTEATSTAVNATLSSFNSGTAAGQLDGTNVRLEGIDRRTMSQTVNVVEKNVATAFYFKANSSGNVNNTTGTPAVINLDGGASLMVTAATITAPSTARLLLHASVQVSKAAIAVTANLPRVWCILQQSVDNGVTWTKLTGSKRMLQMRNTGVLCDPTGATVIPGIVQTFSWSQYVATTNVATYYRVAFETLNGDFAFSIGTISPEVLLQ
jgi:hypothetical protein